MDVGILEFDLAVAVLPLPLLLRACLTRINVGWTEAGQSAPSTKCFSYLSPGVQMQLTRPDSAIALRRSAFDPLRWR